MAGSSVRLRRRRWSSVPAHGWARAEGFPGRPTARTESGTWPMLPPTASTVSAPGSSAIGMRATRRCQRRVWTATGDCTTRVPHPPISGKEIRGSLRFVLSLQSLEFPLGLFDILQPQLPGPDKMHHDQLGASAEHRDEFIDQSQLSCIPGDERRKEVEVANLPCAAHDLLLFHPVDRDLDGSIGWPGLFGKALLNLADGHLAASPESFHDL